MIAIRGATTVEADSPEEIRAAVKELLWELVAVNSLKEEEILFLLFSSTSDIRSLYPAKAAREAGFHLPALFSAAEPQIDGGLPLCIRVLALTEADGKAVPVYLHRAKSLRKDVSQRFAIALDGPAGSGKSTIAKALAKRYDILYLDTGAMYRAVGLHVLRQNADPSEEAAVRAAMRTLSLSVDYRDGRQVTCLNGEDVSEAIRSPEVSMAASAVAVFAFVRETLVKLQREIAKRQSCVLDGRDIGTAVLPDAEFKFFVTASSAVRAARRLAEWKESVPCADFETVKRQIEERDYRDAHRAVSPLCRADDAVVIDTSDLTVEQTILAISAKIQEKI